LSHSTPLSYTRTPSHRVLSVSIYLSPVHFSLSRSVLPLPPSLTHTHIHIHTHIHCLSHSFWHRFQPGDSQDTLFAAAVQPAVVSTLEGVWVWVCSYVCACVCACVHTLFTAVQSAVISHWKVCVYIHVCVYVRAHARVCICMFVYA